MTDREAMKLALEGRMNCCNHDCNQGKDCPHRFSVKTIWIFIAFVLLLFWHIVIYLGYLMW